MWSGINGMASGSEPVVRWINIARANEPKGQAKLSTTATDVNDSRGPAMSRRRRTARATTMISELVAGLLVAGASVAYARWDASLDERLQSSTEQLRGAAQELASARAHAQIVLSSSAGRVNDDSLRRDLAAALATRPHPTSAADDSRQARTQANLAEADRLSASRDTVTAAAEAVTAAVAAWELEQALADRAAAISEVSTAIDAAVGVLADSEGRVADAGVRDQLATAIAVATAVRDAPVADGATVEALTAAAAGAREHVVALAGAQQAVADAQLMWQAEQDRIAAENAAAAARTPTATKPAAGKTGTKPSGGSGSRKAPAASTPGSGASDGSHWEEETVTDGSKLCGDESGNTWRC